MTETPPREADDEPPRVRLRPATDDDSALILGWTNDPDVRAASLNTEPVGEAEHRIWFARRDEDRRSIWIAEVRDEPVGQLRVQRSDDEPAQLSYSVAPAHRGRGFGTEILKLAKNLGEDNLRAVVRPENAASLRAFERAGYRRLDSDPAAGTVEFTYP